MKIKTVDLKWYAIIYNFNTRKIEQINILNNSIKESIVKKIRRKEIINLEELKDFINKEFMYYYWSKSEFEIAVGGLSVKSIQELAKIDIYYQLKPNLDRIVEYINNTMKLNLE